MAEGKAVAEANGAAAETGNRAGRGGAEVAHGADRVVRLDAELVTLHAEEVLQQEASARRPAGLVSGVAVVLAFAGRRKSVVAGRNAMIGAHDLGRTPGLAGAERADDIRDVVAGIG